MTFSTSSSTSNEASSNPAYNESYEGTDSTSTTLAPNSTNPSKASTTHKTTTMKLSDLIQYDPNSNSGDNQENGNSVEINIHLMEEPQPDQAVKITKCHFCFISLLILTLCGL